MLPAPLSISRDHARHFLRRVLLLDTPAPDLRTCLDHHGFVQIDPINVCGRMHDLILRNRVKGYGEGDLHRGIHASTRLGFEHHLPGATSILVAYPLYTPPTKRVRGYYALPALAGTEIVGHIDPKADRAAGRLRVATRRAKRGHPLAGAVRNLARWLNLR